MSDKHTVLQEEMSSLREELKKVKTEARKTKRSQTQLRKQRDKLKEEIGVLRKENANLEARLEEESDIGAFVTAALEEEKGSPKPIASRFQIILYNPSDEHISGKISYPFDHSEEAFQGLDLEVISSFIHNHLPVSTEKGGKLDPVKVTPTEEEQIISREVVKIAADEKEQLETLPQEKALEEEKLPSPVIPTAKLTDAIKLKSFQLLSHGVSTHFFHQSSSLTANLSWESSIEIQKVDVLLRLSPLGSTKEIVLVDMKGEKVKANTFECILDARPLQVGKYLMEVLIVCYGESPKPLQSLDTKKLISVLPHREKNLV